MERNIDILNHLPEIYHTVREFQQIALSENTEFLQWKQSNQQDLLDSFIKTADKNSIEIWEKEIGIQADILNESIDFRRQRLINRYTMKPPFTIRWLEQQLKQLLGNGFLKLVRDDDLLNLTVHADLVYLPILREFDTTLESVLPMTMQYQKQLNSHRDVQTQCFAAAASSMHVHFQISMA